MDASDRAAARARLASLRSHLLARLIGIDRKALEDIPVSGGRTPRDMLGNLARGDWEAAKSLEDMIGGHLEILSVWNDRSIESALAAAHAARAALLSAYARIPSTRHSAAGDVLVARERADASASARLQGWDAHQVGPASVLAAVLRASRKELLTTIALVDPEDRQALRPDLEPLAEDVSRLYAVLGGTTLPPEAHWEAFWHGLHRTHHDLVRRAETLDRWQLERAIGNHSLYARLGNIAYRDRRLAARLRRHPIAG